MTKERRFQVDAMVAVLQRPTLVLNRSWQAVHVATVARALVMLYRGTARVVDPRDYQTYDWSDWSSLAPEDGDVFIQGVSLKLRVPEVVTLADYDAVPSAAVAFSRRNIFKRDKFTCQYCSVQPGTDQLTIDHVVPRSRGGQSTWENCVLACLPCNKRKADLSLDQAHMRLRKQPSRPAWKPLYAMDSVPVESWSRFISEAYWNANLKR